VVDNAEEGTAPRSQAAPATRGMTVFGRQGSPTVTVALPFSRVEVKADDAAIVAELAALMARLARAVGSTDVSHKIQAELSAIAEAAETLASTRK